MRHVYTTLMVMVLFCLSATAISAAPIAEYNFQSGTTASSNVDANLTAGDITNGNLSIFDPNFGGGYATAPTLRVAPSSPVSGSVDTAFSNNNIFSFTLTPDDTFLLDLDSITFDVGRGGSSGVRNVGVRSDLTGSTNLFTTEPGEVGSVRPNVDSLLVDLSAFSEFDNFSGPVTFQFAVATDSTGRSLEFDNLVINGSVVATPEPTTVAIWSLIGFGLVGFGYYRVRRRK